MTSDGTPADLADLLVAGYGRAYRTAYLITRNPADARGALPEHLRVPTVLRYWTGLTEREIATAIRRRPGTVKSRLHEARRRLANDPRIAALAPAGLSTAEEEAR